MELVVEEVESAVGVITLVASGERLCSLDYGDCAERMAALLKRRFGPVELKTAAQPSEHVRRVHAYLDGDFAALDGIEVEMRGTPFQMSVWSALRQVPAGETVTYSEIARRIGRSSAVRAVGFANSRNPIALVIPCHRVIGADGSLTGYAGGLDRKRWLLHHEGVAV